MYQYQDNHEENVVNTSNIYVPQEGNFGIYSNDLQQPSSNIHLNADTSGFFANDNVLINPPNDYNEQISTQNLPPMNISTSHSPNMTFNLPQTHPEPFRFEIPGFQIIIIPVSSQQNHAFLNSLYTSSASSSQLNQEQGYVSGTFSDGSSINTQFTQHQHQHQYDQQLNCQESFNNYNFHG